MSLDYSGQWNERKMPSYGKNVTYNIILTSDGLMSLQSIWLVCRFAHNVMATILFLAKILNLISNEQFSQVLYCWYMLLARISIFWTEMPKFINWQKHTCLVWTSIITTWNSPIRKVFLTKILTCLTSDKCVSVYVFRISCYTWPYLHETFHGI